MTKRELDALAKEIYIQLCASKNHNLNYKSLAIYAYQAARDFLAEQEKCCEGL